MALTIDEFAIFCKKKGFVFRSSDIYGGYSGFFDFGPLGVELFNNIKQSWWKFFVQDRDDMVGMEASVISHPRTWKASGHLESFKDLGLTCTKCKNQVRADHYIEEKLKINVEGKEKEDIQKIIDDNKLGCPICGSAFEDLKSLNLLFETKVGAKADSSSVAYLRGETAQGMFMDFKLIADSSRKKLPFGIAQVGRCFRNEIAPRDFLFRSREFHIAEFEFFIHPDEKKCILLDKKHLNQSLRLLDKETQASDNDMLKKTTIGKMVKEKRLGEWHAYWLAEQLMWYEKIGIDASKLKIREHTKDELSHYSSATFDIDYEFPFGSKEIAGNANRGQYDLNQHLKESGEKLELFDEEKKEKIIPRVIEPTFGVERAFLAVIVNAYNDDKERGNIVLNIDPILAPIKLGVFPLMNKLDKEARELYDDLRKCYTCIFDRSGSIGRRYARADEIGIPLCITFDFESKDDKKVTVRERDTTKQIRVKIDELKDIVYNYLIGESFESLGRLVK
ncbi:MAG: glycine--tRNA ligase [Candidatus Woesearchaeota archaeon]